MHKVIYVSTLSLFGYALIFPSFIFADSSVIVHTSTSGGNSSTTVQSNSNTSSTNTSSSSDSTSIHINSNGQEYDYHSDQPGDVNVKDVNGNVTVNGSQVTTTPGASNSTNTTKPSTPIRTEPTETSAAHHAMKQAHPLSPQHFNLFQFLKDLFATLF